MMGSLKPTPYSLYLQALGVRHLKECNADCRGQKYLRREGLRLELMVVCGPAASSSSRRLPTLYQTVHTASCGHTCRKAAQVRLST